MPATATKERQPPDATPDRSRASGQLIHGSWRSPLLCSVWGAISFHALPVEAYPDVANNYVQVITQWPVGVLFAAEQQVTIPIEIQMNGLPHLAHLRSDSLFGLSSVMLIFDDSSNDDWNRSKVLERLSQVTLPNGLQPQMGTDWSPVGQIYWYTLRSTNPKYDLMELKSIEDWTLEKQFKSVPNVVDVSSFGGITREYQVRVDPNALVSYLASASLGSNSNFAKLSTAPTLAAALSNPASSKSTCE